MDKMRVSKFERLSPKIYSTSRIPELIKFLEYSFKTNKFNEAQTTITNLKNDLKIEIENLERDLYSSKKELELMQRAQGFLETEKIKLENEFRRSQMECELLKETITSLREDKRLSSDREKRTEERYAKVCDELKRSQKNCDELKDKVTRLDEEKKMYSERERRTKDNYTKVCDELKRCQKGRDELNEKITRLLEDQRVSSEREKRAKEQYVKLRDEYSKAEDEKHKMILHLNEKLNELKNQKMGNEKAAEVYKERIKSLESKVAQMNSEVEKLKQEKSEADENVKELRLKLLEADKTKEGYKEKFEDLTERIGNAEKGLAKVLNVDVNDIPTLANDPTRSSIALNFPSCNGENVTNWSRDNADLGNSRKEKNLYNGPDEGVPSPVVHSACKSRESGTEGQPVNVVLNDEEPIINLVGARSSIKESQSPNSGVIIAVSDSDDEAIAVKFTQRSSFTRTNEKTRADPKKTPLVSSSAKRNRSTDETENNEKISNGSKKEKRTREVNYDGPRSLVSDYRVRPSSQVPNHGITRDASHGITCDASANSQDSNSFADNAISTSQVKKKRKTWMFGSDMLRSFEEDPQLYLDAICALHRQQISAAKSNLNSTSSKVARLDHADVISIRELAEYLSDGDAQHRLRKSVSEVKQNRPDVLLICEKLAIKYYDWLFGIYCEGDDPYFGPR